MSSGEKPSSLTASRFQSFDTTCWTVVLEAAQGSSPQATEALDAFCRRYWPPLFAFARGKGFGEQDAQDLTQGFFAQLVGKNSIKTANPARGRLRTFLLTSFQRYIVGEREKSRALKRGGLLAPLSLDALSPEAEPGSETINGDNDYDRRWAENILSLSLTRLRNEFEAAGKLKEFSTLDRFLTQPGGNDLYVGAAQALGLKVETVSVCVHRLRTRFGELARMEVARTVQRAEDLEAEWRQLMEIMNR
ncbi:MAG TPA: sigma-70 family RNA polymerase sigma factor [Verrucomicrobiota bacterium]|nr:RNA polymerase subunit sigma-24 [Verrucomicrobiales bacterium]HRI14386.1 sigma-70 family RNA polymerase sigma factor [Verrucomicrobiota bacterium]